MMMNVQQGATTGTVAFSAEAGAVVAQAFLNDAGATVMVVSESGVVDFINDLGAEAFKVDARKQIGRELAELTGPEVARNRMEMVRRALRTSKAVVAKVQYGPHMRTTTFREFGKNARGERTVLVTSRFSSVTQFVDPEAELVDQQSGAAPFLSTLSQRELEVLTLIAEGLSSAQIAARLKRSIKTVEAHRMQLGRKLKARNRSDLTRIAMAAGLIGPYAIDNAGAKLAPAPAESIWAVPGGEVADRPRTTFVGK